MITKRWLLTGRLLTVPPMLTFAVLGLFALAFGATPIAAACLVGAVIAWGWWDVATWLIAAWPYYRWIFGVGDNPDAVTRDTQRLD